MNIALVSLISDNFLIAFKVFIKSLLEYNPWFNYTFILLDAKCNEETKKECQLLYDKIIFKNINTENYRKVDFNKTVNHLKNTFYKLDIFSLKEYDRIVFIDLDTLILKDIKELFDCEAPIAGVPVFQIGSNRIGGGVNSGVLVINKKFLNLGVYHNLIKIAEYKTNLHLPDQIIINKYFNQQIYLLPKIYNCEKRMFLSTDQSVQNIFKEKAILHYVGKKPWQPYDGSPFEKGYESIDELWKEHYRRYYGKDFNS